jgi:hypothetical protein
MGGGTDVTTTNQGQSTTQLPPWINTAAQQNYAYAQNVAGQPLQQYQGQMVAGVAPQQQQAWNLAASGGNAGQDQYNASQGAYLGVLGNQINPQTLAGTNLSPYMNPYTQDVINKTLPIMQQQLGREQSGISALATQQNAFGGSRMGVEQGVAQAQGALNMAQMAAQLNQANYGQAVGQATTDIGNNLAAQNANQGYNLQAAGGLANLGQQAQLSQARNFEELMTAGAGEQQQQQNVINANMQQFQQAQQYPYQQLGVLQSALGMTPYGQATSGTSTGTQQTAANPEESILGGMMGLGSLFAGGAGGFGGSALGGMATAFGGQSDRRFKTDIKRVGHHPAGVPLYSYRYKDDPKTYPKVVGPMAEDVQKIAPHLTRPIPGAGGKMAVDMPGLEALARGRALAGALSAPGVAGSLGALGSSMRGPMMRHQAHGRRPPPIRGALGG